MHAIVESGGKQYRVAEGDTFQAELLTVEEGEELVINKVIAISGDEGTEIGHPYLDGAKVICKVLEHGKGRKVIVFHYKPKKNIRKKKGHRQPFTKLEVISILTDQNEYSQPPEEEISQEEPAQEEEVQEELTLEEEEVTEE